MKLYQPDYCKNFQCTAAQCQDNCCIGWEIDIDPESYQRYQQMTGELGERVRAAIQPGEQPCFRLQGERCALLNDQNLCEIYRHLGKEGLCQICRDHPLFTDSFGIRRESGLGICCPEAARLLLSDPTPMELYCTDTEERALPDEAPEEAVQGLLSVREQLFALLQNRDLPLTKRLEQLLDVAEQAQEVLECGRWVLLAQITAPEREPQPFLEASQAIALARRWLDCFAEFEPINEKWTHLLCQCKTFFQRPEAEIQRTWRTFRTLSSQWACEYEQLTAYFLFRYFLKSVYTGDCLTPVQFAVVSVLMILGLELTRLEEQGGLPFQDRLELAGLYSKQMEYSEENRAALEDQLIFAEEMDCRTLRALLGCLRWN